MSNLDEFWLTLEEADEPMPLEVAVTLSGLEWYTEGGGGNDELLKYIMSTKTYQTKRFISKILRNNKFQRKFLLSEDFWKLYLLKTKTKHKAIDMLFGKDSTFSLLNWTEMAATRRKYE